MVQTAAGICSRTKRNRRSLAFSSVTNDDASSTTDLWLDTNARLSHRSRSPHRTYRPAALRRGGAEVWIFQSSEPVAGVEARNHIAPPQGAIEPAPELAGPGLMS